MIKLSTCYSVGVNFKQAFACSKWIFKNPHLFLLLILSEIKWINTLLFPLKSSENQRFSDDFGGNRSYFMRINSFKYDPLLTWQGNQHGNSNHLVYPKTSEVPIWTSVMLLWINPFLGEPRRKIQYDNILLARRKEIFLPHNKASILLKIINKSLF